MQSVDGWYVIAGCVEKRVVDFGAGAVRACEWDSEEVDREVVESEGDEGESDSAERLRAIPSGC